MRRRSRWALAVLLLVGAGIAFFALYPGAPERAPVGLAAAQATDAWMRAVRERAAAGDWLVVRGTHFGDQVVAAGSAAELTHAAIYDPERTEVIEANGSGVHRAPLRELLAQARRLQIVRPRDWSPSEGQSAVERARSRVGRAYDWLGTVGLQSDRRFYCTELVLDAYRARERGWMPPGVIHPEHMRRYGEVVFDERRPEESPVEIAAELRARFASRIDGAQGVTYAAEVAPGIWRGGQPDAEGVEGLRSRGIKTVVNLRHYHGESEGELVRAAGMRYERIALESTDPPTAAQVQQFLSIVQDAEARPVYVHCLHGVDRTGTMIAVYRIQEQGWQASDALAEMEHFGAHGVLHDLRRFVGSYTRR
ncbi:MAG: dual specificity protein phosphatase family protein [Sandaracinaceae bacterium]|nr:dual specificity protein phosphatase family protein [Sandaracinaceae bacterium]